MDGDLEVKVENLDQLADIECDILVSEVHEGSMPSLPLTALSCQANSVIEVTDDCMHPG